MRPSSRAKRATTLALVLALLVFAHFSESAEIATHQPKGGHSHPIVAVVGLTMGSETTDFMIPWSILTQSSAAEVYALGTESGPIQMMPALKIEPQMTIAQFDVRFAEGADYVVVPAVHDPTNPKLLEWVRAQAKKGATVMTICDGTWVAANAGILDGRRATGHWYSLPSLDRKFPRTKWVRNQRYVSDGPVITTTGVTASIPASLALVEAIAGRDRAQQVGQTLGVSDWSTAHHTDDFHFTARDYLTISGNELSFWSHENIGIPVSSATDEIALALVADAYSRTWRSQALTVAASREPVRLRRGLMLVPDLTTDSQPSRMLPSFSDLPPAAAISWALTGIAQSYGEPTANHVALEMEYPRASER